jgi:succinate dehydrogenase / fumarate reductase iron-sulfur subunit
MRVFLLVRRRVDPGGLEPEFSRYEVEAESHERVLDALVRISRRDDPTLAFRRSCGHGVCGSDAMIINGRERLACKTLIRDVVDKDGDVVIVEPLRNLPVRKDLVVDQAAFFDAHRSVKPYLIAPEPEGGKERPQTPRERAAYENAANCILCAACYSACPVLRAGKPFAGPAAVAQAFRFNEDSRDRGFEERLRALDKPGGVWPCESRAECTKTCPRGLQVARQINETKRRITRFKSLHEKS